LLPTSTVDPRAKPIPTFLRKVGKKLKILEKIWNEYRKRKGEREKERKSKKERKLQN